MRRDTWESVSMKSVDDHNVLPVTWPFKCKRETDWIIRKFKARYCVIGYIQKLLSPKPLNSYSTVVQWATVRLMFILQCILGLQSQSIDFTNAFVQADIPSGGKILHWNSQGFQEWWRTPWSCYQIKDKPIWSSRSRTPMVWKVAKCFVRARFCDEQGGSLLVHV